jgi:hypothetical protein
MINTCLTAWLVREVITQQLISFKKGTSCSHEVELLPNPLLFSDV